jgi:ABC-2 type transport system ATP-binding protein
VANGTTVILTTHYIDEAGYLADRLVIINDGRILADTTPQELRARGGPPTIRCPLTDRTLAADLPPALASGLDPDSRALVIRSKDVAASLRDLLGWAQGHHLDLAGLEVGPPSLEDAYLSAIGEPPAPDGGSQ